MKNYNEVLEINEEEQKIITSLVNNEYSTKYLKKDILRLQEFLEFIAKKLKSKKREKIDSKDEEIIKINEKFMHLLYMHHNTSDYGDYDIKYESITGIFNKFDFCTNLLKRIIRAIYGAVINQKILDAPQKKALLRCYHAVTIKKLEDFLENGYINRICELASTKNFDIAFRMFYIAESSSDLDGRIKLYNDVFNMMKNREDLLTKESEYRLKAASEWKQIINDKKNGLTTQELFEKYNYSTKRINKIIKLFKKQIINV